MSALASNKRPATSDVPRAAFVAGALAPADRAFGENGHAQVTAYGLGDNLLYLFDKAIRGVTFADLTTMVTDILADCKTNEDQAHRQQIVTDLFVLAFQTRWSRGGKGERLIFYSLMNILLQKFPEATLSLFQVIPHYGYWKDLLLIVKEVTVTNKINTDETIAAVKATVFQLFADQLKKDHAALLKAKSEGANPELSFAAKFAPSEKKEFDKVRRASDDESERRPVQHKLLTTG